MGLKAEDVLNRVFCHYNFEPSKDTVDTLITGTLSMEVSGIVTTFMATLEVIKKTIDLGANMIITHEPTFYHGCDDVSQLTHSEIYKNKLQILQDNRITIVRVHDAMHNDSPDAIVSGVIGKLGWNSYSDPQDKYIFNITETTLSSLVKDLKESLHIEMIRYVGNPQMKCRRVGLRVGACGGRTQIRYLDKEKVDVLVCGEATEWEAVEYTRDAVALGANRAMVILGHAMSEEPGMEYMAGLLQKMLPDIPVSFIAAGSPFSFL